MIVPAVIGGLLRGKLSVVSTVNCPRGISFVVATMFWFPKKVHVTESVAGPGCQIVPGPFPGCAVSEPEVTPVRPVIVKKSPDAMKFVPPGGFGGGSRKA